MTYLELVNDVLIRMRENTVTSVSDTNYSRLIGKFVNDAKQLVENSYDWNNLNESILVSTVAGTANYTLIGAGNRFRVIDVLDDTNNITLRNTSITEMNRLYLFGSSQRGNPTYYGFNGQDVNGNSQVNLYPIPNATSSIYFNLTIPQDELSNDATILLVPFKPVVLGAYALAIAERGEDGSITSTDAYNLYKMSLADYISIESSRYLENDMWVSV